VDRDALTRCQSGFFRIEASSAAGTGGPTAGAPTAGGAPPTGIAQPQLTGAAQPQLIGALHESQVSQHFLPQCQWANHCLHFLHFGLQQTELVQESVQDGAAAQDGTAVVQPQSDTCPHPPLPHDPQ
jgi:hypothetical protein